MHCFPCHHDHDFALTSNIVMTHAKVVAPNGILALASCSSHVPSSLFTEICTEALWRGRRRGYVLRGAGAGQPEDHPVPAAAEELRYLKFHAYQMEG